MNATAKLDDSVLGAPEPLGPTLLADGAHFAVHAPDAEAVDVCLFDAGGREAERIPLQGLTGGVHHGFIPGLAAGQVYGLRALGPWRPEEGLRFNQRKLLVDPYATRLVYPAGIGAAMQGRGAGGFDDLVLDMEDSALHVPKCVLEPAPPRRDRPAVAPPADRIVYELNVKGFTQTHPDVPEAIRGTFAGLAHPAAIAHLARLGVTTVELMPVAAWLDERHLPLLGLSNYWGYNPVNFFAPDPRLAPGGMAEVAAAVDALHAAGIEVFLDVVFNHTAESDERGQTLSLRGLDNRGYYRLQQDRRYYVNDTGCGHTLALDRPRPARLVVDALRHWAEAGGFDGFRFDLAPVLGRNEHGFDPQAALFGAIASDPVLSTRTMIAEPWDIGSWGYRLGQFPAGWGEWSDRYRDDVRRFWRGDAGIGTLATRLAGSADIFHGRQPADSVNFVAAHDGFTLADLVTYSSKHNEANGEGNRDGHSGEVAWNHGIEGPTDDAAVRAARGASVRALIATLLFSRGTPMLGMGDELGRSQAGNNNAYAQDNATAWIDWNAADQDLIGYTAAAIAARKAVPQLSGNRFLTGESDEHGVRDVVWLNAHGEPMQGHDWETAGARIVGMLLSGRALLWINGGEVPAHFALPVLPDGLVWQVRLAPQPEAHGILEGQDRFSLPARSVVLLAAAEDDLPARRSTAPGDALVERLALAAGIAPEWWEVSGRHQAVSLDTRRALLTALKLPHATVGETHDSLARLEALQAPAAETAPARCFRPQALHYGARRFGLTAQLYALRRSGDQGVGDFTTLGQLVEGAAARGAATVGVNPFHALFPSDRSRASPYQPSDRRFLDPALIDLDAVPEIWAARDYLNAEGGLIERLRADRLIDWPAVWAVKREALMRAFNVLSHDEARSRRFVEYREREGEALRRFSLFQALEESTGETGFRHAAEAPEITPELQHNIYFAAYLQFLADEQLGRAVNGSLPVGLYRDLAVSAAFDGAEVWSEPRAFMNGVSIGAPPDPFSAGGQNWWIPPLDPLELQATDYAHFRALLRANMRHAGALRIDHVMAMTRVFAIPFGASAAEGSYIRFPLEGMLRAAAEESNAARCLVVGEDLGTVPAGFRERLAEADIMSYRVLFFERDGAVFRPPQTYPANAVACVATHDLPTLRGWWRGADIALDRSLGRAVAADAEVERSHDRAALGADLGETSDDPTPSVVAGIHGRLAGSPSALVVAQVEDLAGEVDPVNLPGTSLQYPNWRRRLEQDTDAILDNETTRLTVEAFREAGR